MPNTNNKLFGKKFNQKLKEYVSVVIVWLLLESLLSIGLVSASVYIFKVNPVDVIGAYIYTYSLPICNKVLSIPYYTGTCRLHDTQIETVIANGNSSTAFGYNPVQNALNNNKV